VAGCTLAEVQGSSFTNWATPSTAPAPGLVIAHSSAKGTILRGDPRPHTKSVSAAGMRWSPAQQLWYLPHSRDLPPRSELIEHLANELRQKGFEVKVEVGG
jgi:hypothetical protein